MPMSDVMARPEPPPVFCRACVYYARAHSDDVAARAHHDEVCLHPHARCLTPTYWGLRATRMPPDVRNARNDCPDFVSLSWRTLGRWCCLRPIRLVALVGVLGFVGLTVYAAAPVLWR